MCPDSHIILWLSLWPMGTTVLFELIAHRHESGSLLITTNHPFSDWDRIFSDSVMTVVAIDRLVHHAQILALDGQSYRKSQFLAYLNEAPQPPSAQPDKVIDVQQFQNLILKLTLPPL